jgi:hypothetical protein
MAELLRHQLQRASYGTGGNRPPMAALLVEAPAVVGLGSGTSGWGSYGRRAQRRRRKASLCASGRFSGGSGAQHWRQRGSCGVGGEGSDDGAEGGGGVEGGGRKSSSLMVQTKTSLRVRVSRWLVTPLIPDTLFVSAGIVQPIPKNEIIGIG